jgi:hypothetical protein
MTLFLILGDVVLSNFEVPSEIGDLGGRQSIVKHEFPGGLITITPLGAFPDPISWSGILTGSDAFSRSQQLDRIRAVGDAVTLSYGPFAWSGVVSSYKPRPRHQWYVPYTIMFEPIADLSGVGVVPFDPLNIDGLLSTATTAIGSLINGGSGLPLPGSLGSLAQNLLDNTAQGLLNGNGLVAGISTGDAATIASSVLDVENGCLPFTLGIDPTQASPAQDLSVQAAIVGQIVGTPVNSTRMVRTVNPNLFQVAAQYLGDSSKWPSIAAASGLPPDPLPVGMIQLTVPMS